jgi:hypothetical protein
MHQSLPSWILSSHTARRLVGRPRYWFLALISFLLVSVSARAEWITLQIPLSRSSHTMELWEADGLGGYTTTSASLPSLLNGYYDSQGNWRPLATSYARVQVERQHAGDFWLKDTTSNVFGPVNQFGLVNAQWRDTNGQTALRYFVLPESLIGHQFVVQYQPGGETFNVTNGLVQGIYDDDNQFVSFGYFEAWAQRLPGADTGWRLVDCLLALEGPLETENLIDAEWTAFSGSIPVYQVDFIVSHGLDSSEAFALHVEGGSVQSGSSWEDTPTITMRFSGTVPQGRKFWLVRSGMDRTPDYIMPGSSTELDVSGVFPERANFTTESFQFSGYHPSQFSIQYSDGTTANFETQNSYSVAFWDEFGNQFWADQYQATGMVTSNRPWTVKMGSIDMGQGTSFTSPSWPIRNTSGPSGSVSITVVGGRVHNSTLKLHDGDGGIWHFSEDSTGTAGGNFGPNGEYVEWQVAFRSAPGPSNQGNLSVHDVTIGDSISGTSTENWFMPLNLALKISATRLGHDLRIRTGNGQEFPVASHNIQGVWNPGTYGPIFSSYGYFDASASAYSDLPWWLLDYTQLNGTGGPRVIGSSDNGTTDFSGDVDDTDTDGDGWQDWYERLVGTNPNNSDTDGDGLPDATDPNPRALAANTSTATLRIYTPLE